MLTGRQIRRRGFTLVETVVTVGVIAVLAAVVYPQVVKQFDSADPARLAEDLNNITTGIEMFGVNARPQQPDDIEDLVIRPDPAGGSADSTARGALYSATEAANWLGPYIGISTAIDPGNEVTVVTTGFAATILSHLGLFDVDDATPTGGDTVSTAGVAAADFLVVRITGLSGVAFNAVNLLIDGPTENTALLRRQQGRLRCTYGVQTDVTACPIAFYLATPLR